MSLIQCCCPAGTGCLCTWPRVLSYNGNVDQAAAAFYFANTADTTPEPTYTLTWQSRAAEVPKELQLLYFSYPGGVSDPYYITMPDTAWFSGPIPGTSFGNPSDIYFYMWVQGCESNVMVIDAPYGAGTVPDGTRGAGNNVIAYVLKTCTPFAMATGPFNPTAIWGTHGTDDIDPGISRKAGMYTNARVGLTYTLTMSGSVTTGGVLHPGGTQSGMITITSGGTSQWTPTGATPTWVSSDPTVFTVAAAADGASAVVTATGVGTATLTCTTNYTPTPTLTQSVTVS